MLIASSSASSENFAPALMEELGELLVHGITVMPGKPALLAAVDSRHRHPRRRAGAQWQQLMRFVVNLVPARYHWKGTEQFLFLRGDGRYELYGPQKHPLVIES
jgi:hypothetical protein